MQLLDVPSDAADTFASEPLHWHFLGALWAAVQVLQVSVLQCRRGNPRHSPSSVRPVPRRVLHLWHWRSFFAVSTALLSIPLLVH